MFKVARHIPPPSRLKGNRDLYPFRTMKIGESFLIPKRRVPRGPIHGLAKRVYGITISMKKQRNGSVRVWRVA